MQIEKNIAATLRHRMEAEKKSKLEFSKELGIPRSTFQGYLKGENCLRSDSIEEIAKGLNITPAQLISGPDIISRGFVYEKENDKLIDELRRVAMESIAYCEDNGITDWASIKSRVKSGLSGYLFKKTRRSPMILPIIMEV